MVGGDGIAAAASGRGADGLPVPWVRHEPELPELPEGTGLEVRVDLATTDVQSRPELPTGVVTLGGGGREDWVAAGARRSASLPSLGPEGVIVDERRGDGIRVSILRMS